MGRASLHTTTVQIHSCQATLEKHDSFCDMRVLKVLLRGNIRNTETPNTGQVVSMVPRIESTV